MASRLPRLILSCVASRRVASRAWYAEAEGRRFKVFLPLSFFFFFFFSFSSVIFSFRGRNNLLGRTCSVTSHKGERREKELFAKGKEKK